MKQKNPQTSLLLRVLGGGYLLYLAYDLLKTSGGEIQFVVIAILFGLVGAVLLGTSLYPLLTNQPTQEKKDED